MRKYFFALLAITSWFSREWLKEVFWEKALHVLNPENTLLLQYGPPIAFASAVLYLFVKERKRPKREMFAIALMLLSGLGFILGLLLYKGETGRIPFLEEAEEKPQVLSTEKTAYAFFKMGLSSYDVANKDATTIAIVAFGQSPTYITGSGPILAHNHDQPFSSQEPLRAEMTFYDVNEPIFDVETSLKIDLYIPHIDGNRTTAGELAKTLDCTLRIDHIDKDRQTYEIFIYGFDANFVIDIRNPDKFTFKNVDGKVVMGKIVLPAGVFFRTAFPKEPTTANPLVAPPQAPMPPNKPIKK